MKDKAIHLPYLSRTIHQMISGEQTAVPKPTRAISADENSMQKEPAPASQYLQPRNHRAGLKVIGIHPHEESNGSYSILSRSNSSSTRFKCYIA